MRALTAVFISAKEGGYTCWFEEIPEAISEGGTLEEAKTNLLQALDIVLEYRREKVEKELHKRKITFKTESMLLVGC